MVSGTVPGIIEPEIEMLDAPLCQAPDPDPNPPSFAVPVDACDCHAHVIGPFARFPLQRDRSYTPPEAPFAAYRRLEAALGMTRGVLVQTSVFGSDNSCMLDALGQDPGHLRGVAVVEANIDDMELARLAAAGVRGIRFNLLFRGGGSLDEIEVLARRVAPLGWHVEFLLDARELPELAPRLLDLPVDIVIAHLGHMPASFGIGHPGLQTLLDLVRRGRCWVKLSGANRVSTIGSPYGDTMLFARALVDTDPTRLVWGSDWPHVAIEGTMANDGDLLNLLGDWAPDEKLRHQILVQNPTRLYGF
jgi:2-pyrone-4,6-dicarboxylate lactonase